MFLRFVLAVCAASAVLCSGVILCLYVIGVVTEDSVDLSGMGFVTFFVTILALPVCIIMTALLGGLLVVTERKRGQVLPNVVRLGIPAFLTAIAYPLVWSLIWGHPVGVGVWAICGAAAGAVAAVVGWAVMGHRGKPGHGET